MVLSKGFELSRGEDPEERDLFREYAGASGVLKSVNRYWHRDEDELAELAALADGSLDPKRRAAAAARVARSPELAALLAEQKRALALTNHAAATTEAPHALRARITGEQRRPRRAALVAAFATATLAAAVGAGILSSGRSADPLRVALRPTAVVPDAAGEATMTKTLSGWRIRLRARGLPRLDRGRFYEAWLRNKRGVLVPVGTFNEGTDVTLWAGVAPTHFTGVTVTRERDDGNQASSGEKVLTGTVLH
jgi:anti-sigma-K factor RskA